MSNLNTEALHNTLPTEAEIEREAIHRSRFTLGVYKIAPVETTKFWLMALIFSIIAYIYAFSRGIKEAFIIVRQIPASVNVLKLFFVLPIAAVSAMLVQKALLTRDNKDLLKKLLVGYGIYFFVYGIISLPYFEGIEPMRLRILLEDSISDGKMKYKEVEDYAAFLYTIISWTSTIHFIASEIWGTIVLSVLFLSFANDVCPFKQFIRFISLFYIISNIAVILSAGSMYILHVLLKNQSFIGGRIYLSASFAVMGGLSILGYSLLVLLEKRVLSRPLYIVENPIKKKKTTSPGFSEGIKMACASKLVLGLCFSVFFYNACVNVAGISAKSAQRIMSEKMGTKEDYVIKNQFISQLITGTLTILILLLPLTKHVARKAWTMIALVSPLFMLSASVLIFTLAVYNTALAETAMFYKYIKPVISTKFISKIFTAIYSDTLELEVAVGVLSDGLFKVLKYAFFDITKESLTMRIDSNYRSRFKGIYDGIFGKIGRAGSSLFIIIICRFLSIKDMRDASAIFLFINVSSSLVWIFIVFYLGTKYNKSINENTTIDLDFVSQKEDKKEVDIE